jgi:hypothetical protein
MYLYRLQIKWDYEKELYVARLDAVRYAYSERECRLLGVKPCDSCKNRRFGGTYRRYHHGEKNRRARNISSN